MVFMIFVYPTYKSFLKTENIQFDKNLTLLLGGGGNSGILVTDSAVLVIDTKLQKPSKELFEIARSKAGNKKIIVINTHYHGDHINGNAFYKGSPIYIGNYDKAFLQKNIKPDLMPNMFVKDSLSLYLGSDTVILYNFGQAHTFNDLVVYIKNRKLLFSGDLIFNKKNPVLVKASGADIEKWIKVLNSILKKNIITIIPGHGNPGGKDLASSLVQYFEDMKIAATNPDKASELISKYKDWQKMPMMASPKKTIEFIKKYN